MQYVKVNNNTALVNVKGRFDLNTIPYVVDEVNFVFNNQGCDHIVVDFKDTDYIDSSIIEMFTVFERKVGANGLFAKNATHNYVNNTLKRLKLSHWLHQ